MKTKGQRTLFWGSVLVLLLLGLSLRYGWFQTTNLAEIKVVQLGLSSLTANEYSKRLSLRLSQHDPLTLRDPQILAFHKQSVIDEFIHEALVRNWARENKVFVSQKELEEEVQKISSQYPDSISFKQGLAVSGQDYNEWKKQLELNLLQKKLFSALGEKLPRPDENELRSYYNNNKNNFKVNAQVRLRQVVLESEDSAQRLYHNLEKNSDLKQVAKEFSVAPEAEQGGDTGWIEKGTLEVFDQAFKMRVGQRSKVLKSPYGYHIFEVLDKKPESMLNFDKAKKKILRTLETTRQQAAFSAWLEEQAQKSKVLIHQDFVDSLKVETLEGT